MWFIAIGVAMLVMNFAGIGPVGQWTWAERWWAMLLPFGLAAVWWGVADSTGMTQRKAMAKDDARKAARRQKNMDSLGLGDKKKKR
ncbi:MAG: TIGR04438 family Trp-rich protein [Rubrivivax sp.]|nr:MAG: TIGR04438 family Trp-rich protein [Rubrivivax sp.]